MALRRSLATLAAAAALIVVSGCSSPSSRSSLGTYDDSSITNTVMARMVEDKNVDAAAIKVETINGEVTLSGSARSSLEKSTAGSIAMKVNGVKAVRNEIAVRPN